MTPPATQPLSSLLGRGIAWNYGASATTLIAQLLYTAATARLISPAEFGAYATAQSLLGLLSYVALSTLGAAVIRGDPSDRTTGTALSLAISFGSTAMLLGILAAPLWARMWGAPASESLILLFAPVALLTSISAIPLALLRRQLRFRAAAAIESSTQLVGFTAGGVAAFATRSPVALVAGQLVAASLAVVLASVIMRNHLTLAFDREVARRLLHFASSVSGQNFIYYVIYMLPALAIARTGGIGALGAYSRANTIITLPATHLAQGMTKALYPLYERGSQRARALIWSALVGVTTFIWPLFAVVAASASVIVEVLLGEGWGEAATILPFVALFGALNIAYVIVGNPIEAHRHFAAAWRIQMVWLASVALVTAVAWSASSEITTVLAAVVGIQVLAHAVQIATAARYGFVDPSRLARLYVSRALGAALVYVLTASVLRALSEASPAIRFFVVAVIAGSLSVSTAIALRWISSRKPPLTPGDPSPVIRG